MHSFLATQENQYASVPTVNMFLDIPSLTKSPQELFETILLQSNELNFQIEDSVTGQYILTIREELMYLKNTIHEMEDYAFNSIAYSQNEIVMQLNDDGCDAFLMAIFQKKI